jgi:hypothetical protein
MEIVTNIWLFIYPTKNTVPLISLLISTNVKPAYISSQNLSKNTVYTGNFFGKGEDCNTG